MEFVKTFLQKIRRARAAAFSYSLILLFSLLASQAQAEVQYIVARDGSPAEYETPESRIKRFYIEGGWNLHLSDAIDGIEAKSLDGFSGAVGLRILDSFRMEAAYLNLRDKYGDIRADGHWGFLNFIFDAKLSPEYRMFKTNPLVPFVGFGAGAGAVDWTGTDAPKHSPIAYNLIGGVSVEINRTLALSIEYRYIRWLPNELDAIEYFTPISHNISAALRINF